MVPVTGLRRGLRLKLKLAELWLLSPVFNILGGTILILIATTHGVLPTGAGPGLRPRPRCTSSSSTTRPPLPARSPAAP